MANIEPRYSYDEYVFVRTHILEVDIDSDDVRYMVESALSKFRFSQVKDVHTQDPYSVLDEEKEASKREGEEYFYQCAFDMINYSPATIKECFGSSYNTAQDVFNDTSNWDYAKILEAWEIYKERNTITIDSVVYYTKNSVDYLCVVINIKAAVDHNDYILYCPDERDYFTALKSEMRVAGRKADIDEIMNELDNQIKGYDDED